MKPYTRPQPRRPKPLTDSQEARALHRVNRRQGLQARRAHNRNLAELHRLAAESTRASRLRDATIVKDAA